MGFSVALAGPLPWPEEPYFSLLAMGGWMLAAGTKTPVVGVDAARTGQFVAGTGLPLYVAQAVFRTAVPCCNQR